MNSGLQVAKLPTFAEANHPIVQALSRQTDQELLSLFQRYHREKGQFFTAIFCRYAHLVYVLIKNFGRSPIQIDYLFAKTWRSIFHELQHLDPEAQEPFNRQLSLQSWILGQTAVCINQADLPPVESIHYALEAAPPPLWCYLEIALQSLSATHRLMIVMARTFHWSEIRIAAYLQAEGETLTPAEVKAQLQVGDRLLTMALPKDICAIYLEANPPTVIPHSA